MLMMLDAVFFLWHVTVLDVHYYSSSFLIVLHKNCFMACDMWSRCSMHCLQLNI